MFDFPASPTEGQQFQPSGGPLYVFSNGVWTLPSTPPVMSISDAPPSSPVPGQLWWESDTGNAFLWFDDGTSKQWVQFNLAATRGQPAFIQQQVITATGAITLHPDTKAFQVEVQGGGGGAGGAAPAGASQGSAGGGGGGGAYASKWILRTAGLTPTCTVGAVAAGGAGGGAPGVGNTSSYADGVNTVTAAGGAQGGAGASASAISNQGGSGGLLPTTGDINVPGEAGDYGYVIWITANQCRAGKGGNSRFGAGGYSLGVTTGTAVGANGISGGGKGAGGSGGYSMNGGGTWNGGAGSAGVVIITEYR